MRRTSALALAVAFVLLVGYASPGVRLKSFKTPDGRLTADVTPISKQRGFEEYESRISIQTNGGKQLLVHDFSSDDGQHGYGVDVAQWTPDSQFFVCRMRNSGGHSPMYAPVVFWARKKNRYYQLISYTSDQTFAIVAPDKVKVDTWPGMNPATISLGGVKQTEITELR
jgi:hypothetical protein